MMILLTRLFPKNRVIALWQEKTIRAATRVSFAILLSVFAFLLLTWKSLPPQLPLFYSLPWGEEQLGKPIFLLILPLSSLFWGILNFSLAVFSFEKQPLAAKILVWATTWITFLATITLVKIILLIT
ncbi:hypothetical protein HY946_00040 [Candidatus Gottesmanbacteria bacterium]|nr:hypothetical protein [Candidatus Gottesmanbacteria bacterium]